jgi:hypothetical protein
MTKEILQEKVPSASSASLGEFGAAGGRGSPVVLPFRCLL